MCTALTVKLTWLSMAVLTLLASALTMLLLYLDVPVVRYNLVSIITVATTIVYGLHTMNQIMRLGLRAKRRAPSTKVLHGNSSKKIGALTSPAVTQQPTPEPTVPAATTPRRSAEPPWKRSVRKFLAVLLPAALSALIANQYVTIARRVRLDSPQVFVAFCAGSTLLKTVLPLLSKVFMVKKNVRNIRNTFFMLVGPVMQVEVPTRMALQRANQNTTPIYVSSALLNVLEIFVRVASVVYALAKIRRRRADQEKAELIQAAAAADAPPSAAVELEDRLTQVDAAHDAWRQGVLRVCSTEILAEMVAEYCSIGLVSIFMVVLHGNASFDLPASQAGESLAQVVRNQAAAWATQMAFEAATDGVATVIELRAGIPLLDTLQEDRGGFVRWLVFMCAVHSCGLCIASLVRFH